MLYVIKVLQNRATTVRVDAVTVVRQLTENSCVSGYNVLYWCVQYCYWCTGLEELIERRVCMVHSAQATTLHLMTHATVEWRSHWLSRLKYRAIIAPPFSS